VTDAWAVGGYQNLLQMIAMLKMQFYLSKSIILITNKNDDFNLTFVKGGYENVLCCC